MEQVLQSFPDMEMAFAYGSVAFKQKNHNSNDSMLDLVFVVKNTKQWHTQNVDRNPTHYSCLRYGGADVITKVQEHRLGGQVYYNTLVKVDGWDRMIKYGVVSVGDICRDLKSWNAIYLAGRLHKPISILYNSGSKESVLVEEAMVLNRQHALNTAVLLDGRESVSSFDLFARIASLSYAGDFRMTFGENPNKVANIVNKNEREFHLIYQEIVDASPYIQHVNPHYTLDVSVPARAELLQMLPTALRDRIFSKSKPPVQQYARVLAKDLKNKRLKQKLNAIVYRSSVSQSLKGILTAGLWKSTVYIGKKLYKTYGPK